MMEVTVRRGTCWRAFHDEQGRPYLPHIPVAGKTGTLGEQDATFSWFVGFAPSTRPEIVISVLLKMALSGRRKPTKWRVTGWLTTFPGNV